MAQMKVAWRAGNTKKLEEVALTDSPIVVDESNNEYEELHVYKFTVTVASIVNINEIFAKLGEYLDGKINGVQFLFFFFDSVTSFILVVVLT